MPLPILLLTLATVVMSAFGQIALKVAVERSELRTAMEAGVFSAFLAAAGSVYIWGALAIYAVSIVLWLWVLSKVELSLAYPLVSLGFVVTMIFAALFLHEHITPLRIAGTLLIVAGCFCVGRSG